MGPTWGPPGADRTQVGSMSAPWSLLSGVALIPWLPIRVCLRFNILRPEQNGRCYVDDISKCIFLNTFLLFSLKFLAGGPDDNKWSLGHWSTQWLTCRLFRRQAITITNDANMRHKAKICWAQLKSFINDFEPHSAHFDTENNKMD